MADTAYKSTDPEVVNACRTWTAKAEAVHQKRVALSDSMGRNLYVNRGSGHGSTKVVGFERFDSDRDGDLLADGSLIVSTRRGQHNGLVVPNLRRKSGKEYAAHLAEYTTPGLELPGMPTFHIYSDGEGRTYAGGPMVTLWDDETVYALWPTDSASVADNWTEIPLSEYYAAKEAFAAKEKP